MRLRLRTKLLLSLALISSGLTCATLWMVRRSVRIQLRNEIAEDLRNSVAVFRNVVHDCGELVRRDVVGHG